MILTAGTAHAQEESSEEYLSEVRPGPEGQQVPVNIGVAVVDIDGIDAAQQSFVTNFAVSAQWEDSRLAKDTDSVRIMDIIIFRLIVLPVL